MIVNYDSVLVCVRPDFLVYKETASSLAEELVRINSDFLGRSNRVGPTKKNKQKQQRAYDTKCGA